MALIDLVCPQEVTDNEFKLAKQNTDSCQAVRLGLSSSLTITLATVRGLLMMNSVTVLHGYRYKAWGGGDTGTTHHL